MGLFESGLGVFGGWLGAKKNREAAARTRQANINLIKEMDWEPEYAADYVPTYKKAESPIAGSYLESLLMGNNPDSISSTSPGARVNKSIAQLQQNDMFGTPRERYARQREVDAATPWAVKAPTRPIVGEKSKSAEWSASNTRYAEKGVNENLWEAWNEAGDLGTLPKLNSKGEYVTSSGSMAAAASVDSLIQQYGSADAAAEAIRKHGSVKAARRAG